MGHVMCGCLELIRVRMALTVCLKLSTPLGVCLKLYTSLRVFRCLLLSRVQYAEPRVFQQKLHTLVSIHYYKFEKCSFYNRICKFLSFIALFSRFCHIKLIWKNCFLSPFFLNYTKIRGLGKY